MSWDGDSSSEIKRASQRRDCYRNVHEKERELSRAREDEKS